MEQSHAGLILSNRKIPSYVNNLPENNILQHSEACLPGCYGLPTLIHN